ncbi:MAG: hypothetical protein ACI9BF_000662 [Candidatus Paceibacteria bacterium]|jgi:hypothetical protein
MEEFQEITQREEGKIEWNKVTWYSQVLAILLGISIFVLGFWVGAQGRSKTEFPLNSTSVELLESIDSNKEPRLEKSDISIPSNYSTWTTIGTHHLGESTDGPQLDSRDFNFNNGTYSVSFTYGRGVDLEHSNLKPVENDGSKGSFDVTAYFTEEKLFWLNVHDKDGAHRQDIFLASPEVIGSITAGEYEWEVLESTKNGYYDGNQEYLYRTSFGDYVVYLSAGTPVLNEESKANDIINTLSFSLNN